MQLLYLVATRVAPVRFVGAKDPNAMDSKFLMSRYVPLTTLITIPIITSILRGKCTFGDPGSLGSEELVPRPGQDHVRIDEWPALRGVEAKCLPFPFGALSGVTASLSHSETGVTTQQEQVGRPCIRQREIRSLSLIVANLKFSIYYSLYQCPISRFQ